MGIFIKKLLLITLIFATNLTSCDSRKNIKNHKSDKNKIVLGPFRDMVSESTLDETKLQDLPKLIDLSESMTPAKNQSNRGACTYFSTMGMLEGAIKKDLGIEVNLSEEYLIYKSKALGYFQAIESSTVDANIVSINKGGIILEDDWSYQPSWFKIIQPCTDFVNSDSEAPKICFSHNGPSKNALDRLIDSKNIKFYYKQKNTNEIIKFLANNKRPLTMSIVVNFSAWQESGETSYNEELRQICQKSPEKCGGHSIVLTGYDMEKREFMFKNSWGRDWGNNGYGTIPFDVVDKYVTGSLYYAKVIGEVKFPESKKSTLNVIDFNPSISVNKDSSININLDSNIEETSGKMFFLSSYLVQKSKEFDDEFPNDDNTELVRPNEYNERDIIQDTYIRVTNYIVPQEETNYIIKSSDNSGLIFSSKLLSLPSVETLKTSKEYDLAFRTSIYSHNDDEGYVLLKRAFSPIN